MAFSTSICNASGAIRFPLLSVKALPKDYRQTGSFVVGIQKFQFLRKRDFLIAGIQYIPIYFSQLLDKLCRLVLIFINKVGERIQTIESKNED